MGIYIVAREGIWPLHNNMRAPILIDSSAYPEGYPRSDYDRMDILHDGDDWFIVYMEGKPAFEKAYVDLEPMCAPTFELLVKKILNYAKINDGSKRSQIAKSIRSFFNSVAGEEAFEGEIKLKTLEIIESKGFNKRFRFERPSKQKILEKNLRP